ncbi:outer membrane lipoprotein-sorting protein [Azotobacter salinestris]|uniref:outer membrane lipoprotein-sorting protein n=1 Tax=Azotobacter salinestris TaxID=69964 RepID=UPI001266E57E|nr:outer membrane lipoprotein-sorting protein [Azotobacter salinestris]
MKGLSRISAFGLALLVSTLAVAENTEPPVRAVQESSRGFFSRLFGSDDDDKPAERAAAPRPAPAQIKTEAAPRAASEPPAASAPVRKEPEPEAMPQVAKASMPTPVASSGEDPYQILKRADESRGNLQGIAWNVEIESREKGRTDTMLYDIKARGFNISGLNIAPPKSKGQKLLMLDNNMWFHKPGLSKPIPISLRQKLMGQASYGDVASTNYAEDYDATRLPDEVVDGVDCYVFDLKARNSKTTYDRIIYWVDKERLVGVKADYYTLSGKRFKSSNMAYGSTVMINGEARPFISEIAIYEELMSGDVTTLSMSKPKLAPLPDFIFNINLFMK